MIIAGAVRPRPRPALPVARGVPDRLRARARRRRLPGVPERDGADRRRAAVGRRRLSVVRCWVIAAGAAGAFAGDSLSYALGRFVGRPAQERFLRRRATREALGWAERQLAMRGGLVVIVGRYVPGGRTAVTFTAGVTHYSYPTFALFDAVGAVTWATYASLLGYFGGRFFHDHVWAALLLAFGIAAASRSPSRRSAAAPMNRLAARDVAVPAAARRQPGRLVSVGRRGARARARDEDRPILLSIGYAACHWCHVMERESFEDALTARVMNEHFVCVKVDREERPDLDSIYMDAVVALTGQRRLADDRLPDARRRAVLRRHVLPARAAPRAAVVQAGAARRRRGVGATQRDEVERSGREPGRAHPLVGAAAAVERAARRDDCSTQAQSGISRRASTRAGAGWAGRRSSRPRRCSSSCCAAARRR